MVYVGLSVAYGPCMAMGGPSVLPLGPIRPVAPGGALHTRIAGSCCHYQSGMMRVPICAMGGGLYLPSPPGALLPSKGARTRALLHIGRGPLCAYR